MPVGKGSSLKSEERVGWRDWNYNTHSAVRQNVRCAFWESGARRAGWIPAALGEGRGGGERDFRS